MSALVTDQFRILNADNFVESVTNPNNAYYVFLSLPNPDVVGFGRTNNWNINVPSPVDNFNYTNHVYDTMLFGKKITANNVRRVVRKVDWIQGTRYEIYRHDYDVLHQSPKTQSARLYDANYYIINSEYKVYICIDNGSSGINTIGNASQDEPRFTDLEPSKAGDSGDGYLWKYLYTVSPSDIIKFDSTEYITVPNNWYSSTDAQIETIRDNSNSKDNQNQIKKVYIQKTGSNYSNTLTTREVDILGDGTGGKVLIDIAGGKVINATVSSGGSGYSYGVVDLGSLNSTATGNFAKLVPIIPPGNGHGDDLYKELGTDRILIYSRFDDSSKDFPIDTKFAQVGIIKNPVAAGSTITFTDPYFSSVYAMKFSSITGIPEVGEKIVQILPNSRGKALGWVSSYDSETQVLKYIQDRSLYFNQTTLDETDYIGITTLSKVNSFISSKSVPENNAPVFGINSSFSGTIDINFTGISTNPTGNKVINLGVSFTEGLAVPEINKRSGAIIYLDNRPLISRNVRQKEDVKIILEF